MLPELLLMAALSPPMALPALSLSPTQTILQVLPIPKQTQSSMMTWSMQLMMWLMPPSMLPLLPAQEQLLAPLSTTLPLLC